MTLTRNPNRFNFYLIKFFYWNLHKYLKKHLPVFFEKLSLEELETGKVSEVIVSLTSFPARIKTVHLAIKSIMYQTNRPAKVILWLGREKFPRGEKELPISLLKLKSAGLEIEFCDDLKAHTKYYYTFQKFPNQLIFTIDDDIIYPKNIIEISLRAYHKFPNCIIANRIRFIRFKNKNLKHYRSWGINKFDQNPSKKIFATGVGGVLYQPNLLNNSLYDMDGIKKTRCLGDDIWLKAAQLIENISVVYTDYFYGNFMEIPNSQNERLSEKNVFEDDNSRQVKEVFEYFGITEKSFE